MKILWLLMLLISLTGCSRLQLEERLFAVSMGLEQLSDGDFQLSVQVPLYDQSGREKDSGGHQVISVEGKDWQALADALAARSPHRVSFGQLRQIVVHEELAFGESFLPLIRQVFRQHQVRSDARIVVIESSCRDFLEIQKPDTGGHLGKYLDTVMLHLEDKHLVPGAVLGLTVRDMAGGVIDPPLVRGEVTEEGICFSGSALTSNGKVTGYLDGHETQLLALLKEGGRRVNIRTADGGSAEVSAFKGANIRIGDDGTLRIEMRVTAYAPVSGGPARADVEAALRLETEQLITKMQSLGSDAAGFRRQLLWGTKTLREWKEKQWRFETAPVRIEVTAQMVLSAAKKAPSEGEGTAF